MIVSLGPAASLRGFVTPAAACWMQGGAVAEGMRKIGYAGYPFPPRVIHQAIWLYLWTVPAMQGLLRQFGQRSAAAIYLVFGATSLPTLMRYADWRPIILADFGAR